MVVSISNVKSMVKSTNRALASRETLSAAQKQAAEETKRKEVTGTKIGKHVVKSAEIDVQLTEDLSESLRSIKVCFPGLCYLLSCNDSDRVP